MIVEDSHFEYLKLQRGALHDLSGDRAAWCAAYEASLEQDLASMRPFLPEHCRVLLDVGSGLGGIDVLLNRHYGGGVHVRLLDGLADAPLVRQHRETYNHMAVAADFQHKNGVEYLGCYSVNHGLAPPAADGLAYDLVVSLASWCFHYPPSDYLSFVAARCHAATVLILDVRADKPLWRGELADTFREVGCALSRRKFNRLVFHVR
ncbi:hypothetical protein [Bradyrhizobium sp. RDM4]|uniref:hypothetical protein n=1 Tax=Bradyrhizobium sp. RDM4 TaxID=3378765 RepID=UPI0038FC9C30